MTDRVTDAHSPTPAGQPLALRLSEGLGHTLKPAAWQERQKMSNDQWTHWYECQPFPRSAPRDFMIGLIPAQRRVLQSDDQILEALNSLQARVQELEAAEEGAKEAFGVVAEEKHYFQAECKRLQELLNSAHAQIRRMARDAGLVA
jgi:hypothetical protein